MPFLTWQHGTLNAVYGERSYVGEVGFAGVLCA